MQQPIRLSLIAIPVLLLALTGDALGKSIFGWIERVKLMDADIMFEAKLDTGADTSSLNAPDPETFDKDDEQWVRFTVEDDDGESHTLERPLERTVRIRSASGTSERYVVKLDLCLGGIRRTSEVNLADREGLSYQVLIGRNFMEDHVLVDSGPKFTMEPSCEGDDAEDGDVDDDNDMDKDADHDEADDDEGNGGD